MCIIVVESEKFTKLTSTEDQELARLTVKTFKQMRTDMNFDLFWGKVKMRRKKLNVKEPQLPRQ